MVYKIASIPRFSNGRAKFEKINLLSHYENTENISIYNINLSETDIKAHYILDYDSGVWFSNQNQLQKFAYKFAVRGWVWFGPDKGGRCNTIKRTFGEIVYTDVEKYIKVTSLAPFTETLKIIKNRFSNKLIIEIKSRNNEIHLFECNKIKFLPSLRILLLDRKTEKYVDRTEILDSNGFHLLKDLFS